MTEKTEFKKKWENYWYYYKWHTLAGLFALLVILFFIKDLAFREKYDFTITVAVQGSVYDDQQQNIKSNFEKYATDADGDGKVNVGLNIISFPNDIDTADPQIMTALSTRLMAEFSMPESHIYIFDDMVYNKVFNSEEETAAFAVDFAKTYGNKKGIDKYKYYIAESPLAEGEYTHKLGDDWYIVMRGGETPAVQKSEKTKKYYAQSKTIIDKLMEQAKS